MAPPPPTGQPTDTDATTEIELSLLTVEEAARRLLIGRTTMYALPQSRPHQLRPDRAPPPHPRRSAHRVHHPLDRQATRRLKKDMRPVPRNRKQGTRAPNGASTIYYSE